MTDVVSAGRAASDPAISTRNGSPLSGSAQMSTRSTVEAGSTGSSRRPAASTPATRRAGSRVSSESGTPVSANWARVIGTRSETSGSRTSDTGALTAVWDSNSQRMV